MSTMMTFLQASPESLGITSAAIERYLDHVRDSGSMHITIESTPNTADMTHPPALELTAAFAAGA